MEDSIHLRGPIVRWRWATYTPPAAKEAAEADAAARIKNLMDGLRKVLEIVKCYPEPYGKVLAALGLPRLPA